MEKKKYARAPLLYIDQARVNNPEVEMQSQYRSKRKKKTVVNKMDEESANGAVTYSSTQNEESDHEQEKQEQPEKRKSFKEMTIEERVDYFIDSPSYAPKVRSEVVTENRKYRGVIKAREEDHVIIAIGSRTSPKRIPIEEIIDIRIIGF